MDISEYAGFPMCFKLSVFLESVRMTDYGGQIAARTVSNGAEAGSIPPDTAGQPVESSTPRQSATTSWAFAWF